MVQYELTHGNVLCLSLHVLVDWMNCNLYKGQVVSGIFYGDMLYKDCKSWVLYPDPRFPSSAAWPSMPKNYSNGLIILVTSLKMLQSDWLL